MTVEVAGIGQLMLERGVLMPIADDRCRPGVDLPRMQTISPSITLFTFR